MVSGRVFSIRWKEFRKEYVILQWFTVKIFPRYVLSSFVNLPSINAAFFHSKLLACSSDPSSISSLATSAWGLFFHHGHVSQGLALFLAFIKKLGSKNSSTTYISHHFSYFKVPKTWKNWMNYGSYRVLWIMHGPPAPWTLNKHSSTPEIFLRNTLGKNGVEL